MEHSGTPKKIAPMRRKSSERPIAQREHRPIRVSNAVLTRNFHHKGERNTSKNERNACANVFCRQTSESERVRSAKHARDNDRQISRVQARNKRYQLHNTWRL